MFNIRHASYRSESRCIGPLQYRVHVWECALLPNAQTLLLCSSALSCTPHQNVSYSSNKSTNILCKILYNSILQSTSSADSLPSSVALYIKHYIVPHRALSSSLLAIYTTYSNIFYSNLEAISTTSCNCAIALLAMSNGSFVFTFPFPASDKIDCQY